MKNVKFVRYNIDYPNSKHRYILMSFAKNDCLLYFLFAQVQTHTEHLVPIEEVILRLLQILLSNELSI